MRARFLPLLAGLVLLANAGPADARDFLIRPLEIPAGVDPFDSGNWIDTDVTPDGRLHVGYAHQVQNTLYPHQTVDVGPDGAVVVDESIATPFGFVNVDATPSGRLGIGYQAGVTGFNGDLFRTALPPQWDPVQQILPIIDGAATHIAVDRADTYKQVAYFGSDHSLRYAYRSGSTWVVEEVTVMLGQGLGHVDLASTARAAPM